MLASKTLLSVTLAATFASGSFVGFAAGRARGQSGGPPNDPLTYYAPYLDELKSQGYDDAEMEQARQIYVDYWNGYGYWLKEFQDVHSANLDVVDAKWKKRLVALEAKHRARVGAK